MKDNLKSTRRSVRAWASKISHLSECAERWARIEKGREELEEGKFITLDELKAELDSESTSKKGSVD